MTLHVAPTLDLPDEVVVSKQGILATSGAGKSNTAVVMAEQMFAAGLPWVAVDPKGDWWGVRASKDGTGPGLAIPVLGGAHGDVPLAASSGRIVARMVAERRLTCVVDVSEFERQAMWGFLTDFADELLRRNRDPLHVFAEEASDYLPQTRMEKGNLPKAVGAWRRLVAQGRNRGIGVTLISQRSAKIDKDVLDLIETLIAMRATSPRDLNAIRGWVASNDVAEELVDSLPSLGDGEAWIWSPHRLKLAERVRFFQRSTFDSGATPLLAGSSTPVATLADVDLDVLKEELAETQKRADADDPSKLRAQIRDGQARIRELELLAKLPAQTVTETVVETVEVPVVPPGTVDVLRGVLASYDDVLDAMKRARGALASAVADLEEPVDRPAPSTTPRPLQRHVEAGKSTRTWELVTNDRPATIDGYTPRAGARRMLDALARFPEGLTKSQLGTMAKVKKSGGTFGTYASELRRAGLITIDGQYHRITDAGIDAVGGAHLPSDPDALRAEWAERLGARNGGRRMFDLLVETYPRVWALDVLADAAEIERSGGSFGTYLSRLRTNGLIEETPDGVRAAEVLFS